LEGENLNVDLLSQIQNSINITRLFIERMKINDQSKGIKKQINNIYQCFIKSEQSLLWGHSFNPAPKKS